MRNQDRQKQKWRKFFSNWKRVWRDSSIPLSVKAILFDILLYRSDSEGWYISERKLAKDLGIGKQTASNAIDYAVKNGWLLTGSTKERERRKLRLSGLLQSPNWVSPKPNPWVSVKPSKYQRKYQDNNTSKSKKKGEMTKALSPEEQHRRIKEMKKGLKNEI